MIDGDRRTLLAIGAALGLAPVVACAQADSAAQRPPIPDLYRTGDPAVLLAATRALLAEDKLGTLITVDAEGRPRARTVLLSAPDEQMRLWIGARAGSRKLAQIAAHPQATVHVALDGKSGYASLMGHARIVTDPAQFDAHNPYRGEMRQRFFPDYPRDFALIAFTPDWLEVATEQLTGKPDTWQPEGLAVGRLPRPIMGKGARPEGRQPM